MDSFSSVSQRKIGLQSEDVAAGYNFARVYISLPMYIPHQHVRRSQQYNDKLGRYSRQLIYCLAKK